MATRSKIGYTRPNSLKVTAVYCHYDGDINGVGKILYENYSDLEKVKALISFGDMSSLEKTIENTDYYYKRGETDIQPFEYENRRELLNPDIREEFTYVFEDGIWLVASDETNNMFVPLSEKLGIEKETATETKEEVNVSFNRDEFFAKVKEITERIKTSQEKVLQTRLLLSREEEMVSALKQQLKDLFNEANKKHVDEI